MTEHNRDMVKETMDLLGSLRDDSSFFDDAPPAPTAAPPASTMKRDAESLDDFEHLTHDHHDHDHESSPDPKTQDLITSTLREAVEPPLSGGRDAAAEIDKRVASNNTLFDETSSFLGSGAPPGGNNKMDSNLLDFGDPFPDRTEGDDKLEKFFSDMKSHIDEKEKDEAQKHHQQQQKQKDTFDINEGLPQYNRDLFDPILVPVTGGGGEKIAEEEPEVFKAPPPITKVDFPISDLDEPEEPFVVSDSKLSAKASEIFNEESDEEQPLPPPPPKTGGGVQKEKEVFVEEVIKPKVDSKINEKEAKVKSETVPIEPVRKETVKYGKKEVSSSNKKNVIEAEAMFCKMGLDAWFDPQRLDPRVESLIYWRDPKKSGPVFGSVLLILLSLKFFSLISVVAYVSLLALAGTIAFRIYKNIVQAIQKTGDGNPFNDYLAIDLKLPEQKVEEFTKIAVAHANAFLFELRRLFLVDDLVDSIKFGVLLWCCTYLGAWFNGITLIILAWVLLFSLPKVYETNKTQIDANLDIVKSKLAEITTKVKAAIPIGKKPEEKKE